MFAAPIIIILQVIAGPAVPEDTFAAHAKVETLEASPAPSVTRPLAAGAIIAAGDIRVADTGDQAAVTLIGKQTRRYMTHEAVLHT